MSFKIEEPDGSIYDHAETIVAEKKILDAAPDGVNLTLDQACRLLGERHLKLRRMRLDHLALERQIANRWEFKTSVTNVDRRTRSLEDRGSVLLSEIWKESDDLNRLEESLMEKFGL